MAESAAWGLVLAEGDYVTDPPAMVHAMPYPWQSYQVRVELPEPVRWVSVWEVSSVVAIWGVLVVKGASLALCIEVDLHKFLPVVDSY